MSRKERVGCSIGKVGFSYGLWDVNGDALREEPIGIHWALFIV